MINFRYHLVSLVAVFLALAIGIVAGSTVIKESLLDQTQQNLDRAEQNLKDLEDSNAALRSELDQLNRRDQALDKSGVTDFLQDRLDGLPVVMMKVDGVDEDAATALRQAIDAAGARYAGTVTLTDRLALATPADVERSPDRARRGDHRSRRSCAPTWPPGWRPSSRAWPTAGPPSVAPTGLGGRRPGHHHDHDGAHRIQAGVEPAAPAARAISATPGSSRSATRPTAPTPWTSGRCGSW